MGRTMIQMRLQNGHDHQAARSELEGSDFVKAALSHGLEAIDYFVDAADQSVATVMLTMHEVNEAEALAAALSRGSLGLASLEANDSPRVLVDPRRLR